jgi:hypothetical protein
MRKDEARVRGILLLNTVRFVTEFYGEGAHPRVMAAVDDETRGVFLRVHREAAWVPLAPIVRYMEAAQRVLDPGDATFHRRIGRFSGRLSRVVGGFLPMVASGATAVRMATKLWRAFYDRGRPEVVSTGPDEALVRLHDFPAYKPHCDRFCGALESLIGSESFPLVMEELSCGADGHACCEMRARWAAPSASPRNPS